MKEVVVTVSSKGQIVIPKEVREHLGIERGNKVTFVLESQGTVTLKAPKYSTIASLRGAAGRLPTPLTWEEMRTIAREDRLQEAQPTP
ncbi:MAG: AbrB/MazE/SpoVT family DNA-binding domain-containing protein [Caldilineaceae bacterium]